MADEKFKQIPVVPNDVRNEDGTVFSLPPTAKKPASAEQKAAMLVGLITIANTNSDDTLSLREATTSEAIKGVAIQTIDEQILAHAVSYPIPTMTMEGISRTSESFVRNFVMDDQPLFNVPELLAAANNFQRARAIDTKTFGDLFKPITLPKGVENLKLSDFCPFAGEDSAFNCQNLPNGKIFVSVKAPGKT